MKRGQSRFPPMHLRIREEDYFTEEEEELMEKTEIFDSNWKLLENYDQ